MLKLLPLSTLVIVLSTLYRDASTAESEIFHIKSETVIQTSKFGNEEQYHFPSSLEYTVTSLQQRFSLRLSKSDKEIKPMRTRHGVHSSILLVEQETFSHRQVAIYTDVELKTIVALNCDSTYHTCHLTGSICNKEKRWMISPVEGEPNKYIAVRQYGATYDITDAMRDGQQWQINGENPTGERRPHQHVRYHFKEGRQRRDIDQHVLNRQRRADTNCNIFEVLAVPDATVFEFFLERNNQDRPAAFSDQFQHYSALFREVDFVLFGCAVF